MFYFNGLLKSITMPCFYEKAVDYKATIKLGEFSRGGLTRGNNKAYDHDMGDKGKHTPFGIVDEEILDNYLYILDAQPKPVVLL